MGSVALKKGLAFAQTEVGRHGKRSQQRPVIIAYCCKENGAVVARNQLPLVACVSVLVLPV